MENELVSVIVAIYNIDKYLDDCIRSIIKQSYKNLEILLVNDGSTDNSEEICKKWAKKDNRIILCSQENQGLSVVRNQGIKKALGKYTLFVDGDDVLDLNMIMQLVHHIQKAKCDLILCNYQMISEEAHYVETKCDEYKVNIVFPEQVHLNLLNHIEYPAIWNGLYKTELIKNITFPIGKKNEDVFWKYKAIDQCNTIGIIQEKFYGYRIRNGSLMQQKFTLKDLDALEGTVERAKYLGKKYPKLKCPAYTEVIAYCMIDYISAKEKLSGKDKKIALDRIRYYKNEFKLNFYTILKEKNISKERKYSTALACVSFCIVSYLKNKILEKSKVKN